MIFGIGTDIVQVDRFKRWQNYSKNQLLRVFSENEINYCCKNRDLKYISLECLASRFAAKEAFFKAFSQTLVHLYFTQHSFSFLFSCKHVEVLTVEWGVPKLKVDWQVFGEKVGEKLPKFQTCLSVSHEKNFAVSFVVIF